MERVFEKTCGIRDVKMHYCPGCTHGIIHRLVGEVLEELDVLGDTIGVAPVGCSLLAYDYFNCDMQQAAHGRAPAVATGIKRVHPDKVVFTYQGDGDLAAIGTAEIIHSAARAEKFTTILVNNCIYGMTGGQMSPATLIGQKATTAQDGRKVEGTGMPLKMSEMLATIDGAKFVKRVSIHNPANIRKAKKAIKEAFELQIRGEGFGIVEVLSTCPTNWGLNPVDSIKWLEENMLDYYKLGDLKNPEEVK